MRATKISQPISINRKCDCCKKTVYISKNNVDDAIFYDKKSYHRKCFIDICNKRANMKRENVAEKWQWVLRNIENIQIESREHFFKAVDKEEVNQFILEEYDLSIIPSSVWQKLGSIYSGTFRGMSIGISPNELIDMWRRKIDYLNKVANQNVTKGKVMNSEQRINYDLSILVNKYDGYRKWKENQKKLNSNNSNRVEKNKNSLSMSIINEASYRNTKNNDAEISDLVDDIFD